ncbi:glycosyltransferase family 4 protein [Chitinibacter bivalviorum]|uniref:Glycosyltransferase family 4 protein n=1 Tax=Chitinibacter bivalviorum TaxID=2739434 RepID=A0A7H9BIJ8_9NEIS|nr:glycosyltransferase family 4 protein [Chitinibacter bivalviorum]QLG87791.1 glycosyltransferase family 4 protein [Chitinibacter bivalviorum]
MPTQHRIAYLVSQYPAASHVFILREILGLRARGFEIHTASVNPDTRALESLPANEQIEQHNTLVIKNWPRLQLGLDLLLAIFQFKSRTWRALAQSWRLAKPGWRGHGLAMAYFIEALLLARWLKARDLDHLHVHFGNEAALVGVLCKTLSHCQLSFTIHGPDEFYDVRGQQLQAKISHADLIICISQFARSQLMLISSVADWAKMQVVRLGINPEYQAGAVTLPAENTLLCVGRLVPAKGQRVLLQALAELAREGLRPQLTLAGGGADQAELEQLAAQLGVAEQVCLTGPLSSEATRQLYRQAKVFVLPSFAEGIPVVLMEAMASGVPCISSRITGIAELIEHEKEGLLIHAGDSHALAQAIKTLLFQPDFARSLALAAQAKIKHAYHLERNLDQLAQCFSAFNREPHHA